MKTKGHFSEAICTEVRLFLVEVRLGIWNLENLVGNTGSRSLDPKRGRDETLAKEEETASHDENSTACPTVSCDCVWSGKSTSLHSQE